jgi:hypothetical protein
MARDGNGGREGAEARFQRVKKIARSQADSDLQASRKKTARLKAERLAKEAAEGISKLDKKPAPKKARARKR